MKWRGWSLLGSRRAALCVEGGTTSSGKLGKSGPHPSLYTLSYQGGEKHGGVRIEFANGAVSDVSLSPKKRPNPKNIPVTKEQLRGVLDPMTGAVLRLRPNLPQADLKVCGETIPVFDGRLRFDIVLEPKQQAQAKGDAPDGYSGPAAICGVRLFSSRVFGPAIGPSIICPRTAMRSRSGSCRCPELRYTCPIGSPCQPHSALVRRRYYRFK
jgi:hypothetical protein